VFNYRIKAQIRIKATGAGIQPVTKGARESPDSLGYSLTIVYKPAVLQKQSCRLSFY